MSNQDNNQEFGHKLDEEITNIAQQSGILSLSFVSNVIKEAFGSFIQ